MYFSISPLRTGREPFSSSGSPEFLCFCWVKLPWMDVSMALSTQDQCLSVHRNHPLHSFRFDWSPGPAFLQIDKLANMMHFAISLWATEFALVGLESLNQIRAHGPKLMGCPAKLSAENNLDQLAKQIALTVPIGFILVDAATPYRDNWFSDLHPV